mmetsp:Transcript_15060/g.43546  ORF Transcript_15060/g.43546 Transcript_15060/m.43546 type:complete len:107 (-) Transcript_15060:31-351(-)
MMAWWEGGGAGAGWSPPTTRWGRWTWYGWWVGGGVVGFGRLGVWAMGGVVARDAPEISMQLSRQHDRTERRGFLYALLISAKAGRAAKPEQCMQRCNGRYRYKQQI